MERKCHKYRLMRKLLVKKYLDLKIFISTFFGICIVFLSDTHSKLSYRGLIMLFKSRFIWILFINFQSNRFCTVLIT